MRRPWLFWSWRWGWLSKAAKRKRYFKSEQWSRHEDVSPIWDFSHEISFGEILNKDGPLYLREWFASKSSWHMQIQIRILSLAPDFIIGNQVGSPLKRPGRPWSFRFVESISSLLVFGWNEWYNKWRVWSWLRSNAGGVAKTCKSHAKVPFGERVEWRKGE